MPIARAGAPRQFRPEDSVGDDGGFSRREFLTKTSAAAAGALAIAPLLGRMSAAGAQVTTAPDPSSTDPRTFGAGLDLYISQRMHNAYLTSVAAAAVRGTDLEFAKGYGLADREQGLLADADTDYMLASISKTFICAAIMQLWETGSVDLDADVNTYLPFEVRNPAFPSEMITPRMLLTHTSSIRDRSGLWGTVNDPVPVTGYVHGDATLPLGDVLAGYLVPDGPYYIAGRCYYGNRPGSTYRYSNLGADLAAYIVEYVSGQPYGEYCRDNLFLPLGMTDTGLHLADISPSNLAMPYKCNLATRRFTPYYQYGYADYPCGAVRTSANSLSIWLRCFINHGSFDGTRILKSSTVAEILRPQIPGIEWGQGLIWYYIKEGGDQLVGHNGGDYGVSTEMYFSRSRGVGALILTNRYIGGWTAWFAFEDIRQRLMKIA